MKQMDIHMKNTHFESEDLRIIRITKAVETVRQCEKNNQKKVKIQDCSECGVILPTEEDFRNHNKNIHNIKWSGVEDPTKEEEFSSIGQQILPDKDFLTKNTADLKLMLEAIPQDTLAYDEDTFEKDFKLILNSVKNESQSDRMISLKCEKCNFRGSSRRCLNAHISFVHSLKYFKCDHCPVKTRTEQALYYHIDVKHNTYWDVEEDKGTFLQRQNPSSPDTEDKNTDLVADEPNYQEKVSDEITIKEEQCDNSTLFKCDFCEKTFITEKGRGIHIGKMHKEQNGVKREHEEETVKRANSTTRSPPMKKSKEYHQQNVDLDHERTLREKNDEILELRNEIHQLKLQFQLKTTPSNLDVISMSKNKTTPHHSIEVNVNTIQVLESTTIHQPSAASEPAMKIGKQRLKVVAPSTDTVIFSNLNDVTVLDIPELPFTCQKCEKRFTHRGNLKKHMNDHNGISNLVVTAEEINHMDKAQVKKDKQEEVKYKHKKFNFSIINNCPECEEVFHTKLRLEEHYDAKHIDAEQPTPVDKPLDCKCAYPCIPLEKTETKIVPKETIEAVGTNTTTKKAVQFHCALINNTNCLAQYNTQLEMDKHIMKDHNKKSHLQCTVCDLYLRDLDDLAKHMNMTHKKETISMKCNICGLGFDGQLIDHIQNKHMTLTVDDISRQMANASIIETSINCHQCNSNFDTNEELTTHIKEYHTNYKPCDYFKEDRCQDEGCRFYHFKLSPGEHICYKCGKIFKNKRDLIKHIQETHSHIICHRFQRNECTVRKCFFRHVFLAAGNVDRAAPKLTPPALTEQNFPGLQDFPNLPTARPVVWTQGLANGPQTTAPSMSSLSQQFQNQMNNITSHVIEAQIKKMLPQIVAAMTEALSKTNLPPQ